MSLEKISPLLAAAVPKAHVNLLFEEDFNRFARKVHIKLSVSLPSFFS